MYMLVRYWIPGAILLLKQKFLPKMVVSEEPRFQVAQAPVSMRLLS
jgi:hypothetical protein